MNKILIYFSLAALFLSCDQTTEIVSGKFEANLLPHPKEISLSNDGLALSISSKLYTSDQSLKPLLALFSTEVETLTGINLSISSIQNQEADILFAIDTNLAAEEYQLSIDQEIAVKGGSYQAIVAAKNSLLQLVSSEDQTLFFPLLTIRDFPDAPYRGLMIDLARQWHDLHSIEELIDLASFYKLNYVQLHFTDYQSFTFPSSQYPKLATAERHYSIDELKSLEAYAKRRGITIIPELEVPGHASQFVLKYPEIFAIQDTANNPWIINMGREEVYEALDAIIGEMAAVFESSPYFHIGGDEAIFNHVDQDPDVKAYMLKYQLGTDVHELYRHFLVRMNQIVKKHGKQMCVWEGFRPDGQIHIPKDIIVFEFETNRYLPNLLVEDGYQVVNTSWKPIYVVNQKKWAPKTIYDWNLWRWENWWPNAPSFEPIQVEKSPLVIGAQMCAWEQAQSVELPSLRKRVPVFLERIWNTEQQIPYEELMQKLDQTDKRLSVLIGNEAQDSLLIDYNFVKPAP